MLGWCCLRVTSSTVGDRGPHVEHVAALEALDHVALFRFARDWTVVAAQDQRECDVPGKQRICCRVERTLLRHVLRELRAVVGVALVEMLRKAVDDCAARFPDVEL